MLSIITNPTIQAIIASVVALPLMFVSFLLFEPALAVGQSDDAEFIITQSIDTQISVTEPDDINLSGIDGLTGGDSQGSTSFFVATNNNNGYTVDITFEDTGTGPDADGQAMVFDSNNAVAIQNGPTAPVFTLPAPTDPGEPSAFAFTVDSDQAAQNFRESSGDCNETSGSTTGENCFMINGDITVPLEIMTSNSATAGGDGDEATLVFRVVVGPNADPVVPNGTYTATATITANIQ